MTKVVEEAGNLCYRQQKLYFSAATEKDEDESVDGYDRVKNTAIYYKNMPKSGKNEKETKLISDKFKDIVQIAAFDSFIYVADQSKGFYAIEAFGNDEFSDPRQIELILGQVALANNGASDSVADDKRVIVIKAAQTGSKNAPKPQAMVVFTLNAIMGATASLAATIAIISVTLF